MELLQKYCPIIYLHSNEKYYPLVLEDYLDHCSLWLDDKLILEHIDNISELSQYWFNDHRLVTKFKNIIINDDSIITTPIYGHYYERDNKKYLLYIFYYAYNRPYKICCNEVGGHYADFEHITIELGDNDNINRIYFSAHGYKWGSWINGDKVEYKDGRPIVYVANGSHGNYWRKGIHWRIYGIANDICDRGIEWDPREVRKFIVSFKGTWGNGSVRTANRQKWWNEESNGSKWWERLFLPFKL